MARSSKIVGCSLQEDLLKISDEYVSRDALAAFLRVAFIEKLNRDFGCDIDPQQYAGGRGSRFDMKTEKGRAKAEKNLAKARSRIGVRKPVAFVRITGDGSLVPVSSPQKPSRKKSAA